jgi:hypothetical protein
MKAEKFPLSWPAGYPVTEHRIESKFSCTFAQARDGIFNQIDLLGAKTFFISCNVQRNKKGDLVEGRLIYDNPGVALYFNYKGEDKVIACDKWKYIHENLRAVEKSLEAIRGLERWGCSDIISRAMGGLKELAENAGESNGAWWQVLGVDQDAPPTYIEAAYKQKVKIYHPDKPTGNRDMFELVLRAYNEAKQKGRS